MGRELPPMTLSASSKRQYQQIGARARGCSDSGANCNVMRAERAARKHGKR